MTGNGMLIAPGGRRDCIHSKLYTGNLKCLGEG